MTGALHGGCSVDNSAPIDVKEPASRH